MSGFTFRFGLPLFVCALLATSAQAQVRLVPMENVPLLKPLVAVREKRETLPPEWEQLFRQPHEGAVVGLYSKNGNTLYRQAHSYPEMDYIPLVPGVSRTQHPFGAKAVIGYTKFYTNRLDGIVKDERKTVWTWNVPAEQQRSHVAWGRNSNHDRFSALMLSPADKTPGNPTLVCFEATAGLQWQQSVPMSETLQQFLEQTHATKDPEHYFVYDKDINVSMTENGSRLLLLIARPDYDATLLFVYDGGGNLLKSLALQHYVGDCAPSGPLTRLPEGSRFFFPFWHSVEVVSATGETSKDRVREEFIADADGNLLCQFVDNAGKPFPHIHRFTDDGAYAFGSMGGSDGDGFIYALPPASDSKRKP